MRALGYFQRAIKLDPAYAPAYAALADTYTLLSDYGLAPATAVLPKAQDAAKTALHLDDTLAEAHASLAFARYNYLEWPGVEAEYQKAIELNPGYATAHHWYATALAETGREDEAITEIKLAEELDPRSQIISANVAWCYYLGGRYDQAVEQARKTVELDPSFAGGHSYLAQSYLEKGMYREAFEEFRKALSLSGGEASLKGELANAYAVAGRNREALELLKELQELSRRQYVSPYSLALVYVGLGDKDRAFEWLNKAFQERSVHLMSVQVHPRFASLRSDQRFEALVRRIGLPTLSDGGSNPGPGALPVRLPVELATIVNLSTKWKEAVGLDPGGGLALDSPPLSSHTGADKQSRSR